MTQIRIGDEEYRRLLREWCQLTILDLDDVLTEDGIDRLATLEALLEEAELVDTSHTEEVHP